LQDGSGTITIKEFEKGFQVETTSALFEALGLKAEDAWTLFRSLDKDLVHDHTQWFALKLAADSDRFRWI